MEDEKICSNNITKIIQHRALAKNGERNATAEQYFIYVYSKLLESVQPAYFIISACYIISAYCIILIINSIQSKISV